MLRSPITIATAWIIEIFSVLAIIAIALQALSREYWYQCIAQQKLSSFRQQWAAKCSLLAKGISSIQGTQQLQAYDCPWMGQWGMPDGHPGF
jgi:hypothetical protein